MPSLRDSLSYSSLPATYVAGYEDSVPAGLDAFINRISHLFIVIPIVNVGMSVAEQTPPPQ